MLAGRSNGGHHTKWLIESFPALYDGGLSMYGYNSGLEMWRAFPIFLRNYDIIEPRITDIIAARGGDVTPPLTRKRPRRSTPSTTSPPSCATASDTTSAARQGSEHEWPAAYAAHVGYLTDSIGEWDPTYDPNRDGHVSLDELKTWNPYHAPAKAQAEMRLLDLTGDLSRPIIVGQGSADPIVSPKEAPAYQQLVARTVVGDDPLRTYIIPGMGHGGAGAAPFVEAALTEVEDWITYRQTGGAAGSLPGSILGLQPLPHP